MKDDKTPITKEWTDSLEVDWLGWCYSTVKPDQLVAVINSPAGGTLEIHTRGEFRRLCAALDIEPEGIELNRSGK